jgi:hypothetical protein
MLSLVCLGASQGSCVMCIKVPGYSYTMTGTDLATSGQSPYQSALLRRVTKDHSYALDLLESWRVHTCGCAAAATELI